MTENIGRLVYWPDIFPRVAPEGKSIHYLSWPSWERCLSYFQLEDKRKAENPPLDMELIANKAPGSEPILVEEPQNFLRSLITLKDGLDFFHKDFSLPLTSAYVEESVRDIKNAISPQPISSKDPNLTSPTFVPHLNLALWTLGELLKDDAQRNLDLAKRKNHELISVLRGPEDSEEADALLSPEGQRPALSPLPPILPDPPLVPLDAKPFQSCISIKTASCLLDAWLFLAKGFIRPGDLLWTPYEEYPTLLEGKLEPFPGHPEIFIYADL